MSTATTEQKLESIRLFASAAVAMGKVHTDREAKRFDETGESGYEEGWAAGYACLAGLINDFVTSTLEEES